MSTLAMGSVAAARLARRRCSRPGALQVATPVLQVTHRQPDNDPEENERATPARAPAREPAIPVREPVEPDEGSAPVASAWRWHSAALSTVEGVPCT